MMSLLLVRGITTLAPRGNALSKILRGVLAVSGRGLGRLRGEDAGASAESAPSYAWALGAGCGDFRTREARTNFGTAPG